MDVVGETDAKPRRTKRRGRHLDKALSAAFVRSAPAGRHADGKGLYLFVQPTGTRSWVQRLVIRGRRRELGLGAATLVPLAKAREQALANRMLARSGGDPLAEKRRVQGVPTFAEAAQRVLEQKRAGWRGRWHAQNWWRSMERYGVDPVPRTPILLARRRSPRCRSRDRRTRRHSDSRWSSWFGPDVHRESGSGVRAVGRGDPQPGRAG